MVTYDFVTIDILSTFDNIFWPPADWIHRIENKSIGARCFRRDAVVAYIVFRWIGWMWQEMDTVIVTNRNEAVNTRKCFWCLWSENENLQLTLARISSVSDRPTTSSFSGKSSGHQQTEFTESKTNPLGHFPTTGVPFWQMKYFCGLVGCGRKWALLLWHTGTSPWIRGSPFGDWNRKMNEQYFTLKYANYRHRNDLRFLHCLELRLSTSKPHFLDRTQDPRGKTFRMQCRYGK